MDSLRLIRSELAYWNDDKTKVELYEEFVRFIPVGDKAIDVKYGNIASCKRYIKELLITSKGSTEDGYYDIHYIPLICTRHIIYLRRRQTYNCTWLFHCCPYL